MSETIYRAAAPVKALQTDLTREVEAFAVAHTEGEDAHQYDAKAVLKHLRLQERWQKARITEPMVEQILEALRAEGKVLRNDEGFGGSEAKVLP